MHFREFYVGLLIDLQKITCISKLILHNFGKVKKNKKGYHNSKINWPQTFLSVNENQLSVFFFFLYNYNFFMDA